MPFYKDIEIRNLKLKYSDGLHRALFAKERILPGELIWYCECSDDDLSFTRAQLLDMKERYPKLDQFLCSFSYMVDDDIYAVPVTYHEEKNNDECALFNHSCIPNCGFDETGNGIRAIRTIEPGDELSYHYGFLETEASLIYGFECKCGSSNCEGNILFDHYRDDEFVGKYFQFFTPYLRKKAIDMKEKWYNGNCYVKRIPSLESTIAEDWTTGLFTLKPIKKDELIASFSTDEVVEGKHFIRHSSEPNCYIKERDVFACVDIPSETELTIYYHGVLL